MSRWLRVGDHVTATGTVIRLIEFAFDGTPAAYVRFHGPAERTVSLATDTLTLITPAEPPVGSVVVKDGVAWARGASWWYGVSRGAPVGPWDDISDGQIIFTPGGSND